MADPTVVNTVSKSKVSTENDKKLPPEELMISVSFRQEKINLRKFT